MEARGAMEVVVQAPKNIRDREEVIIGAILTQRAIGKCDAGDG